MRRWPASPYTRLDNLPDPGSRSMRRAQHGLRSPHSERKVKMSQNEGLEENQPGEGREGMGLIVLRDGVVG